MRKWLKQNVAFVGFLLLLGVFRTAVADWNPIPSSSMRPNLLEGDVVFVNRLAYDVQLPLTDIIVKRLHDPQRGDVVTFASPADGRRLIKRVIAVPGDVIEMIDNQLVVNGRAIEYAPLELVEEQLPNGQAVRAIRLREESAGVAHVIQWMPDVQARHNFARVEVPADHYLMLGDNRDVSVDFRSYGLVPRHLLIGRAERILVSADILDDWALRFDRFGQRLN